MSRDSRQGVRIGAAVGPERSVGIDALAVGRGRARTVASEPTRREFLRITGLAAAALAVPGAAEVAGGQVSGRRSSLGGDALPRPSQFDPPIGVCTSPGNAKLLKRCGVDYVEVVARWFLMPDKPNARFAPNLAVARKCILPIRSANGFLPRALRCTGPAANHEAVLRYAATAFARARQVGIDVIVFGSGAARTPPEGFPLRKAEAQFTALLRRMGPLAEPHGVTVVLEPLRKRETPFIRTVAHGARIVRAVNHPNIRLLADCFHMACENEPPEHIRHVGDLLHHVHIAQKDRTPPAAGGDDLAPYLSALRDIGYRGRISMECRWKDMAAQLPGAVAALRTKIGLVAGAAGRRTP